MNLTWELLVQLVKRDAEENDYMVDFLTQVASVDHTCYIYFRDDDQSAIYTLTDADRLILIDTLTRVGKDETVDTFWMAMNETYRMTE
jgi:hypothetical protein